MNTNKFTPPTFEQESSNPGETPLQARIREAEEQGWVFQWTNAGCHVTPPTTWHAWVNDPGEVLVSAGISKPGVASTQADDYREGPDYCPCGKKLSDPIEQCVCPTNAERWPESQFGGDGPWNNYGE